MLLVDLLFVIVRLQRAFHLTLTQYSWLSQIPRSACLAESSSHYTNNAIKMPSIVPVMAFLERSQEKTGLYPAATCQCVATVLGQPPNGAWNNLWLVACGRSESLQKTYRQDYRLDLKYRKMMAG
jgi:hypothetical protein